MKRLYRLALLLLITASYNVATAAPASIHDVIEGIHRRMQQTLPMDSLVSLSESKLVTLLTPEERRILGTEYITFHVNQPVMVRVFRDTKQPNPPWWLEANGFKLTNEVATTASKRFEIWIKHFDAGEVNLGVHSLANQARHYVVVVTPHGDRSTFAITDLQPKEYRLENLRIGSILYRDLDGDYITEAPEALLGDVFLVGTRERTSQTFIAGAYRTTEYPSSTKPEQVALTMSEDPRTTQAIQWRTNPTVADGVVRFRQAGTAEKFKEVIARRRELRDRYLVNDPVNARFTVDLRGLTANTRYEYQVGSPSLNIWSEVAAFTTAPDEQTPFSFMFLGDPQRGFDEWGELIRDAHTQHPDTRFWVIAGDLVNSMNERQEWDAFFTNAEPVFREQSVVPANGSDSHLGSAGPWMYLQLLDLPENGPESISQKRVYSFRYGNALFLILDSNHRLTAGDQARWIDEQLAANADATWKFVVYHHPAFSAGPRRDNPEVREIWGRIFDRHHVDVALQGHDHSYMRTYPMREGARVDSPADGTIYVIAVSGSKYYPQAERDFIEVGFTNVPTYQVISIDGARLQYQAYDGTGTLRDEFAIEK